jgi:acetolactate decarboxylase
VSSYAEFQKALISHYATNQMIRALQVKGFFNTISVTCSQQQEPPYKPFKEASRVVQKHTWKRVKGTLIGFWFPPSVPDAIISSGFHLHFISEDKTKGGCVIDFESDKLILYFKQVMRMTINYAPASTTHFDIPPPQNKNPATPGK